MGDLMAYPQPYNPFGGRNLAPISPSAISYGAPRAAPPGYAAPQAAANPFMAAPMGVPGPGAAPGSGGQNDPAWRAARPNYPTHTPVPGEQAIFGPGLPGVTGGPDTGVWDSTGRQVSYFDPAMTADAFYKRFVGDDYMKYLQPPQGAAPGAGFEGRSGDIGSRAMAGMMALFGGYRPNVQSGGYNFQTGSMGANRVYDPGQWMSDWDKYGKAWVDPRSGTMLSRTQYENARSQADRANTGNAFTNRWQPYTAGMTFTPGGGSTA